MYDLYDLHDHYQKLTVTRNSKTDIFRISRRFSNKEFTLSASVTRITRNLSVTALSRDTDDPSLCIHNQPNPRQP